VLRRTLLWEATRQGAPTPAFAGAALGDVAAAAALCAEGGAHDGGGFDVLLGDGVGVEVRAAQMVAPEAGQGCDIKCRGG